MQSKVIMRVRGQPVNLSEDGTVNFIGGMSIDCDGSPHAYAPLGIKALDYLANAGHPGNWWGIVTFGGDPVIQTGGMPAPGFYVSTTSYERGEFRRSDPRRYLDSEKERFIVIPGPIRMKVGPVILGALATVTNTETGQSVDAVVGDIGPATHLGEASMAVAEALGVNPDPKTGGEDKSIFVYRIFPGTPAPGYKLQPA